MPGRRYPRRSQSETQSSHVRSVFRGGMDGTSHIPYPVGWRKEQSSKSNCLETLFFNDEFAATGGSQSVSLTWLPLPYSEHVYLWRGGQGIYQSEGTTWVRDAGSRTVRIQAAMGAQAGDYIVVEYAYYAQAVAIEEPCGPGSIYPLIVANGGPVMELLPSGASGNPGLRSLWLPYADGFPVQDYWGTALWVDTRGAAWGPLLVTESVPGIAPGSPYAQKSRITSGSPMTVVHVYQTYATSVYPRWSQTTRSGSSTWYEVSGVVPQDREIALYRNSYWTDDAANDDKYGIFHSVGCTVSPGGSISWYIRRRVRFSGFNGSLNTVSVPFSGDPYAPGPHFISFDIDCASKTMTVKFDNETYSYTDPEIWPDKDKFTGEAVTNAAFDSGQMSRDNDLYVNWVNALTTDQFTITEDMPWCAW